MTRPKNRKSDYSEEDIKVRVEKAVKAYRQRFGTKDEVSIRKAAKLYSIVN